MTSAEQSGFPTIAIVGLEDLPTFPDYVDVTRRQQFCESLSGQILDGMVIIDFPATDPTTLVDPSQRDEMYRMGYVGPDMASLFPDSEEVAALMTMAGDKLPGFLRKVLGVEAELLADRGVEAFVTGNGLHADPHLDSCLTIAGYYAPGSGLVVSHDPTAKNIGDIEQQPATLVLARTGSFVLFNGTEHGHSGVDFDIDHTDTEAPRAAKVAAVLDRFNIVRTVQNLDPAGVDLSDSLRLAGLLEKAPYMRGFRTATSFNYRTEDEQRSTGASLTSLLTAALNRARKS